MTLTPWKRREVFTGILLSVFVELGLIGPIQVANASTTIVVSTNSDVVDNDGQCSLREAIAAANTDTASGSRSGECPAGSGNDTITIPSMQISLNGSLTISSPIVVAGAGVGSTIFQATRTGGIIAVNSGPTALRGATVQGWTSGNESAITVSAGTVDICDVRITGNTILGGGAGLYVGPTATVTVRWTTIDQNAGDGANRGGAGGIANSGNLVVQESLIAGNTSNRTGGIWNGPTATLKVSNTTLSGNAGNSPDAGAGGLVNTGSAFLNHVTITQNKGRGNNLGSFRGGGLQSYSNASTIVKNSIIANNDGRGGPHDCAGTLTNDSRNNLIRDTMGCQLPAGSITAQDPQLSPLGSNGGPTRTHALSAGSPAIDRGGPDTYRTDQRGYLRGALPDLGTFEFGATAESTSSLPPCSSSDMTVPAAPLNLKAN